MSIVCGFYEERPDRWTHYWGVPTQGLRCGWPLGRVALRESELVAYAPMFFGRLAHRVPYGEISQVHLESYIFLSGLRIQRSSGSGGDVLIRALSEGVSQIAASLTDRQVRVVRN